MSQTLPQSDPIVNAATLPDVEVLRAIFTYDPDTGQISPGHREKRHGYMVYRMADRNVRLHRVIWKMMTGEEPPPTIDHINGDKSDNRWVNLRVASQAQQVMNRAASRSDGVKGITWDRARKKWQASITHRGRRFFLGRFDTKVEAAMAYNNAALKKFGPYARLNHVVPS